MTSYRCKCYGTDFEGWFLLYNLGRKMTWNVVKRRIMNKEWNEADILLFKKTCSVTQNERFAMINELNHQDFVTDKSQSFILSSLKVTKIEQGSNLFNLIIGSKKNCTSFHQNHQKSPE